MKKYLFTLQFFFLFVFNSFAFSEFLPTTNLNACTGSNCVNLNSQQTLQTIDGWEGTDFTGYRYIPQSNWDAVKENIFNGAVNDLGITTLLIRITQEYCLAMFQVIGWNT